MFSANLADCIQISKFIYLAFNTELNEGNEDFFNYKKHEKHERAIQRTPAF